MHYESKFGMGQVIWMARSESFHRIVKCFPCSNTGKVKIGDEEFICPKCGGRSAHMEYAGKKFYVVGDAIIGKIDISDYPTNWHKDEPNPKVTYMLSETGIGSGTIWNQEDLFASKEEAQAFCDRHNGVLPSNEAVMMPAPIDTYGRVRTAKS